MHSTRLSERHYFRSVGRPNCTFSTEWPMNRGLAVEMGLRGRAEPLCQTLHHSALGAWKPAKDAGFHIPTATATAAVKMGQTAKPAPIVHFYRFLCRTDFCISYTSRLAVPSCSGGEEPKIPPRRIPDLSPRLLLRVTSTHPSSSIQTIVHQTHHPSTGRHASLISGQNCGSMCHSYTCLLYTSPSPRDRQKSRMPSSA